MVLILEAPHQDLDVVEFVTISISVYDVPILVYHLLHIFTLVSAHERLSSECIIDFGWGWNVPLTALGSLCMEQVRAERALEKSLDIAVRNIRGMDVILLQ